MLPKTEASPRRLLKNSKQEPLAHFLIISKRSLQGDHLNYYELYAMKQLFLLLISLFLVSCGATVAIDYDTKTDFTDFTTYQFYQDIDSGLNDLDNKRIMSAIENSLQNRGFTRTDYCRFYIDFYASESISESRNTLGIGIGGGGRNVGVGVSGGIPIGGRVINQQLTIDIIDATMDQELAWQAKINGELSENATPEQREAYYISAIEKALQKFPPK